MWMVERAVEGGLGDSIVWGWAITFMPANGLVVPAQVHHRGQALADLVAQPIRYILNTLP
jgi:hypothetical protein